MGKKNIKQYLLFVMAVYVVVITGCGMFNQSVPGFLEYWTDVSQVSKHSFDGSYPETGGLTNLPSGGDRVMTYYLVNPQNYDLDVSVKFAHDDSLSVDNKTPADFATVEQDAVDKSIIRLTLKNSVGVTGILPLDGDGTDISPMVSITEPNSGRNFGSYTVPVRVNSAPEAVQNAGVIYDPDDNTYVICFNMPDMTGIHRDIVSLSVSGDYAKTYTVTPPVDSSGNGLSSGHQYVQRHMEACFRRRGFYR